MEMVSRHRQGQKKKKHTGSTQEILRHQK
jgi:hypothetical protein